MFNTYEFTFAGESSMAYGLMMCDIDGNAQDEGALGNVGTIIEDRIAGRVMPYHYGVDYNKSPLQFKLVFGTDSALDRFDIERIGYWLTGHQNYQWLTIDEPDLDHLMFRCLITELRSISIGWLQYGFEATVVCDCPYAYSYPFQKTFTISGETDIEFYNESSVREYIRPKVIYHPSSGNPSTRDLSITNTSDGDREFVLNSIPITSVVEIDNENGVITDTALGRNLYAGCNFKFLRLVPGLNELVVTGNGSITISGQYLYNVGS